MRKSLLCGVNVDMYFLIHLVKAKPVIWDKTCEMYKDRNETMNAWREIFVKLRKDFDELDDVEKNDFGKQVMKRWGNARDAFKKFCKRQEMGERSGDGASTTKTYIYEEQLNFLKRNHQELWTKDSSLVNIELPQEEITAKRNYQEISNEFLKSESRKRKSDCTDMETFKENTDRHLLFFQGNIPSLYTFDNDEILEFQIQVLNSISSIKNRRKMCLNQTA